MKNILVIGGAGFIGSHTVIALGESNYRPVILDNFSNSERFIIDRIKKLTKKDISCYDFDYRDKKALVSLLKKEKIEGVIHFAAYKAVGESVQDPLKYYDNNVGGFISLLQALADTNINRIVFSSSSAVYGQPSITKVTEETVCQPLSPYGTTKFMDELILRDTCQANSSLNGIALRYFNVVGAHPSGLIGELPKGKPQNLLPVIIYSLKTKRPFTVFGNDYPTADGTCIRDYIDVNDLAEAHVKAIDKCFDEKIGYRVYNIGTGKPTSVFGLIETFEKVNDIKVKYKVGARRAGDPAAYYATNTRAVNELNWKSKRTIEDSVRTAWQWHLA